MYMTDQAELVFGFSKWPTRLKYIEEMFQGRAAILG